MDDYGKEAFSFHLTRLVDRYGPVLSIEELAIEIGKTRQAIYIARHRNKLPIPVNTVGGNLSILATDLAAFFAGSFKSPTVEFYSGEEKPGRPSKREQRRQRLSQRRQWGQK